jgi:hypothetical protein
VVADLPGKHQATDEFQQNWSKASQIAQLRDA